MLLIMRRGEEIVECFGLDSSDGLGGAALTDRQPPPLPDARVTLETRAAHGEDDEAYSQVVGRVGPSVTGIDLVLSNGRKCRRTGSDAESGTPNVQRRGGEAPRTMRRRQSVRSRQSRRHFT
jgi:hypothetical protein